MKDRFDFEQEIMDCWSVTNDIQTIIDSYDGATEDQLLNMLIGVKELYDAKFRILFDTFEGLVSKMDRRS